MSSIVGSRGASLSLATASSVAGGAGAGLLSALGAPLPLPLRLPRDSGGAEGASLVARLDSTLDMIQKEYAEFNAKHPDKPKKIIPALFYSFYRSPLCAQLVLTTHAYLLLFVRAPVQEGEQLDGSGPDSTRDPAHDSNFGGKKLRALQRALQRVAACYSGVLLYRAEMNRFSTAKKTSHFLNDHFDAAFFETLYLLVEYMVRQAAAAAASTRAILIALPPRGSSPSRHSAAAVAFACRAV